MSSRVIKANNVTFSEEAQLINVPAKNYFNPNINPAIAGKDEGFRPASFLAEGDEGINDEFDDFVDPDEIVKIAEQQAENIIKEANDEANLIIQKAKLQGEEEREAAREEGRAEGFELGCREAEEANAQLLEEADRVLLEAREEREAIIASIEPEMVNLIADITEKLVGNALVLNPNVILYLIESALQGISGVSELTVRVSKDDFEVADSLKDEIIQMVDSDIVVSVVKDTGLIKGDCIVDTPIGSIDSSLNKQWQSLRNDLLIMLSS